MNLEDERKWERAVLEIADELRKSNKMKKIEVEAMLGGKINSLKDGRIRLWKIAWEKDVRKKKRKGGNNGKKTD